MTSFLIIFIVLSLIGVIHSFAMEIYFNIVVFNLDDFRDTEKHLKLKQRILSNAIAFVLFTSSFIFCLCKYLNLL